MRKTVIFLFWFIFLFAVFIFNRETKSIRVEFDAAILESDNQTEIGQFYYDTGKGFSEKGVVAFKYFQLNPGQFGRYSIRIPVTGINRLRFDPLIGKGSMIIKNLVVKETYPVRMDRNCCEEDLKPVHNIGSITISNAGIQIISNGPDPHLILFPNLSIWSLSTIHAFSQTNEWDKIISGMLALILLSALLCRFTAGSNTSSD